MHRVCPNYRGISRILNSIYTIPQESCELNPQIPGTLSPTAVMSLSTLYIPSLLSVLLYLAYRKWSQSCLSDIPGPTPESFWLGS